MERYIVVEDPYLTGYTSYGGVAPCLYRVVDTENCVVVNGHVKRENAQADADGRNAPTAVVPAKPGDALDINITVKLVTE